MIKITALNKIYKSKKRTLCHALKNINLTLPDNGLVFVLGKSGSGKSTLLNLIGGLDNISSGSIEVDGNDLAAFKEKDFCNYRNTHIGFIFQDYHLIDELTVYENIVLSLNLRRIEDKDLVSAALAKVDLAGYENRYPTELSGGEQQRVAIARAIVKNPRIILADEPTGNLDTNTSTAIITLLKQLSKECLILIVSHNVNDANGYADRIIELAKGKIISDLTKNPDFTDCVTVHEDTLVYPLGRQLSDEDIDLINTHHTKNLIKRTDKFILSPKLNLESKKLKIENKSFSFAKVLDLSGKFLKNKAVYISLSSFMVAVIMVIMALAQTIIGFEATRIIREEMEKSNQKTIFMNKLTSEELVAQLNASYYVAIGDKDIQAIRDAGYQNDIYPVLNLTMPVTSTNSMRGVKAYRFTNSIYLGESLGTIVVDEDFLARKFGDIKYHAIRSEVHPQGVIITDYIADAILKQNNNYKDKDYRYLVQYGLTLAGWNYDAIMINGIIDTGYKDQYRALFERVIKDGLSTGEDLYNDTELQSFINDVYDRLGYCYTTNQNFYEDYINAENWRYPIYHKLVFNNALEYLNVYSNYIYKIEDNGDKIIESLSGWRYTDTPPEIPEGAKYIRVAYPPALETYLKKTFVDRDPESFLGYARLRFDDGELISEELMNFESSLILKASGEGIFYNNKSCMVSDYIPIPEGAVITEFSSFTPRNYAYCAFYDEDKNVISTNIATDPAISGEKTIVMPYKMYNDIFGTDFSSNNVEEFVPHTVNMAHYMRYDVEKENPLFKETVYIAGLTDSNIFLSEDLFTLFYKDSIMVNGLYLDGTDNIGGALNVAERLNMEHQSFAIEGIRSMTRAVEVFVPIFEFIAIFLYVGVIFILVNFSSKMINDKMHEIGILKALGTKNKSIGVVFGLQLVFIAILTCALSTLGYYMFIDVANDILVDSVKSIAPTWTVLDLQFLTYQPDIAKENCILIFALAFISLVFPMIKIKAIKPVKIIKAKE